MLWLIDNYDSFTFNVLTYLRQLGAEPRLVKNDQVDVDGVIERGCTSLLLSPGPGKPEDAGFTPELVRRYSGDLPILGICLGHEVIAQVFGARVGHARKVMHGKVSTVYHDGKGVFLGVPNPVRVCRYHSLIVDPETLPDTLEVSAWTQTEEGEVDEVMGLRHTEHPTEGIQFHPEAILTDYGHLMLANFLRQAQAALAGDSSLITK
ncbi:MAG: aminodeoxychorismate/anthranilate synthase component II [Oceanospirillaceae bacterium]|nr:aminodeoxychorismate/anthranilate synthase component II [Oceanospirillaceae bacterium]